MRILVTGGAGFIGSHLVGKLLQRGDEVVCLDNFNDFYDPAIKRQNVSEFADSSLFTLMEGDILDVAFLDEVFQNSFDVVVHLAAYAGVRPSIENPALYQRVNIEGTLNLLECCKKNDVDRLVFASSSSVYGGRKEVPFRETDNVMHPISPYAATKAAGEVLCHTYHHLYGISVHALRFFTVYGPKQRPEMAIHLFASKMLQDKPVKIYGDVLSSRDYTYITDIIDGLTASIDRCSGFEVINLGGSATTALGDLVQMIGSGLGVTPKTEQLAAQPGDVPITFADVSKAAKLLDYAPKVPIEKGIKLFCDWMK